MDRKLTVLSDQELIRHYKSGNTHAFDVLAKRHSPTLKQFIITRTNNKDVADDILQTVLIKVYQLLLSEKYNDQNKFLSWVMAITKNQVVDYFRQEKIKQKHLTVIDHEVIIEKASQMPVTGYEEVLITEQTINELHACIEKLPSEQLDAFMMFYYGKMLCRDIAKTMNAKLTTTTVRLRYARLRIRKLMSEQYPVHA